MKLMAETLAKYRLDETTDKKEEIKMSLEEAIKIIQVYKIKMVSSDIRAHFSF